MKYLSVILLFISVNCYSQNSTFKTLHSIYKVQCFTDVVLTTYAVSKSNLIKESNPLYKKLNPVSLSLIGLGMNCISVYTIDLAYRKNKTFGYISVISAILVKSLVIKNNIEVCIKFKL